MDFQTDAEGDRGQALSGTGQWPVEHSRSARPAGEVAPRNTIIEDFKAERSGHWRACRAPWRSGSPPHRQERVHHSDVKQKQRDRVEAAALIHVCASVVNSEQT